jgi:hypothetical protein
MRWADHDEHAALFDLGEAAVQQLTRAPGDLQTGEVHHWQHTVMAHRVASLGRHLDAVLMLTLRDYYGPALALTRTSLEHVAIDQLVFLADKYVQEVTGVTDEVWDQWQKARDAGEDWTQDITTWDRPKNKDKAVLVREGIPVRSESGETEYLLSYFYRLMENYRPFAPRPNDVERLDNGLDDLDVTRRHAAANKADYQLHLRWPSIKRNLQLNGLADEFALEQLETHYRFLSAFTHPITDTRGLLYGRNEWSIPRYDHYSSELCLLYVIVLASWELQNFTDMSRRPPTVTLAHADEVETLQDSLRRASAHFWFVGGTPHAYDRFQARNQASWKAHRAAGREGPVPRVDVADDDIGYYTNPLERLVDMHGSTWEYSTGFGYESPWPREDARFR